MPFQFFNFCVTSVPGLAGVRTVPSSIHRTPVWWTCRYWGRTSSCTRRRDAVQGRAYGHPRGNPRWPPYTPTRRTPRKVRNTLSTHSTEWAVRVFIHSLTKQATCYTVSRWNEASDSFTRQFISGVRWKSRRLDVSVAWSKILEKIRDKGIPTQWKTSRLYNFLLLALYYYILFLVLFLPIQFHDDSFRDLWVIAG